MDRRSLLTGVGSVVTMVPVAGCQSGETDSAKTTNNTTTENTAQNSDTEEGISEAANCEDRTVEEWARNDIPPHEIVRPEESDWKEHYLGENIEQDPTLSFEELPLSRTLLDGLRSEFVEKSSESGHEYFATVLTDDDDIGAYVDIDALSDDDKEILTRIDFEKSAVVLVFFGAGSSSVTHQWVRVEPDSDGVHLHGYYTRPEMRNLISVPLRFSAIKVDRPDREIHFARVSFTQSACTRVHFDSRDGRVTLLTATFSSERDDAVTAAVRITTATGEVRVDDELEIDGTADHGPVITSFGEVGETYMITVKIDALGIDVTKEYHATEPDGFEITLHEDDDVTISGRQ